MRKVGTLPLAIGLAILLIAGGTPVEAQDGAPSLYQRMGGYNAIAAFVADFFGRFDADPELAPYLGGLNASAVTRVFQHSVEEICLRTGGPCLYNGQPMKATHEGLGIPDAHFDLVITHMAAALVAEGIGEPEQEQLLAMFRAERALIVGG